MAIYVEDWSGQAVGAGLPAGWSNVWHGSATALYEIVADLSAPGGKRLNLTRNQQSASRAGVYFDAPSSDPDSENFDALCLLRLNEGGGVTSPAANAGIYGRGSGVATSVTNSSAILTFDGDGITGIQRANYSSGSLTTDNGGVGSWVKGELFWLRLTVSGSTATARAYPYNDPKGTPISEVSSLPPVAAHTSPDLNHIGIFHFRRDIDLDVLWFGVGTGTDEAPLPDGWGVDAPTGTASVTSVTPGITSAEVRYGYDAFDAEGFEYRIGSGSPIALGSSPATIYGLSASTSYSVQVRAINSAGAGDWSAPFSFTTQEGATQVPQGTVTVDSIVPTSTSATIEYSYSDTDADGFQYRIAPSQTWMPLGASPASISGLSPNTSYTVQVRAINAEGGGTHVSETFTTDDISGIVIHADFERASVDQSMSEVTMDTDGVVLVKLRARTQAAGGIGNRWIEPFAKITGAMGETPRIEIVPYQNGAHNNGANNQGWLSNMRGHYSYDGKTWTPFDTLSRVDRLRWRNNTPFTQDEVWIARSWPTSVTDCGEWIEGLLTEHPSLVRPAPSALAFTPVKTLGFPAQSCIAEEIDGIPDERGSPVPDTPYYAFEVSQGNPSECVVISAGIHAGEDLGEILLRELVDWLLGPTAEAMVLRTLYKWRVYPLVNPLGRWAGYWRGAPGSDIDPNRDFASDPPAHQFTQVNKDVYEYDLDGKEPWWGLAIHATVTGKPLQVGARTALPLTTVFYDKVRATHPSGDWGVYGNLTDPHFPGGLQPYWESVTGMKMSLLLEVSDQTGPVSPTSLRPYAQAIGAALYEMDQEGLFYQPIDGSAEAHGDLSAAYLSPSSGVASGGARIYCSIAEVSLTSPSGVASGEVIASGRLGGAYAQAPGGAAQVGSGAFGAVSSMYTSAPNSIVVGGATAHSAVSPVELSAPTGIAVGAGSSFAAGAIAPVILFAPLGTASGYEPPEPPIPVTPQGNDFYSQMAAMTRELLAPTSMGGLGQGVLELTRVTPGVPDPDQPWLPVQPVRQTVTLRGAVRGISAELVGANMNGTVLVASDRVAICAVPSIEYTAGDVLTVDGVPVHVIAVENIPAAGVRSAVRFIIRGG